MGCRLLVVGIVGFIVMAGCNRAKPPDTIVRGQVLYRGEPVSGGVIVFTPNVERGSDGPFLTAILASDGSFDLTGPEGKPIQSGWYRISVAPKAGTVEIPNAVRPYPGLPSRFRNPALSGLEHEVKAGTENLVCLDLDDH